jgi:phage terminase large subunit-like protein
MTSTKAADTRRYGPKPKLTAAPLPLDSLPPNGGARVAAFLERFVRVPKGTGAGKPFVLRPWQVTMVNRLFDEPRPRAGLISIPRGNGKSTLAAALGIYGLFGDEESSPQVLVIASDERQAGIVRNIARRMVEISPELAKRAHIFKDSIRVPSCDGTFASLPADPAALHGWDPTLLIADELHVVSEQVWEAATSAAGKRERSLTLAISTPAASRDSLMWRLVDHARTEPDESFYFKEWAAPDGCDVRDEEAWELANPALDDFLSRDGLRSLLGTLRPESFRRLRLGQWVEDAEAWIAGVDWAACSQPRDVPNGTRVALGFDGSVSGDATALVGATVEERPHVFVLGLWERPDGPQGADWAVPRDDVNDVVEVAFQRYDVVGMAIDPPFWRVELEAWAQRWPGRIVEFATGVPQRMAPAVERFYSAVRDRTLTHDGDPRLTRHVLAAVTRESTHGPTIAKDKRMSKRKIDGAVAAIIGLQQAAWHQAHPQERKKVTAVFW